MHTHFVLTWLTVPSVPAPPTASSSSAPIANISPDTAVTAWSSAQISNWPDTPMSFSKKTALSTLTRKFLLVNEDILLIALEQHNYILQDTIDTLLGLGPTSKLMTFLSQTFPDVPCTVITDCACNNAGHALATFSSPVREFHANWQPIPTCSSGILSLSPPVAYQPNFIADRYLKVEKESDWWVTTANTIRWQVPDPSPNNDTWNTIQKACQPDHRMYSPCLADMVQCLIGPEEHYAFSVLSILPSYTLLTNLAANDTYHNTCANIVLVLASHGMATPGTIAWALDYLRTHPTYQISLHAAVLNNPKLSSTIWNACNNALYAYWEQSAGPCPEALVIDIDALTEAP